MSSYRYHGNYCGPGWSAGKYQTSVESGVPAVDDFDQSCKDHDAAYARGESLDRADAEFVKRNFGVGLSRTFAASAVSLNSTVRRLFYGSDTNKTVVVDNDMPRKAGSASYAHFAPPSVVGTGIRLADPVQRNTKDGGVIINGSELIPSPRTNASTTLWDIVQIFRLSPVHYGAGRLGRFAQFWSEFRFHKVSVSYVTACGTTNLGNLIVEYQENSADPCRHYAGSSFLQNVMTSGNGTLMPVWENFTVDLPINDSKFHPIGSDLTFPDQNDASAGDVIVYNKCATASTDPGFFIMNYVIEFRSPQLSPRLTVIPYATGAPYQNWFSNVLNVSVTSAGVYSTTGITTSACYCVANTSGTQLAPDTIYKAIIGGAWTQNTCTGGNGTVSSSLVYNTKGQTTALPDLNTSTNYGYTIYISTFGAAQSSKVVGTMYASITGALTGNEGASAGKDVIVGSAALTTSTSETTFPVWMIAISLSAANQQSNT